MFRCFILTWNHGLRNILFSNLARFQQLCRFTANPSTDHSRVLRSKSLCGPFSNGLEPPISGRPRYTWLRTVESDLQAPLNIGLAAAYRRAQSHQACSTLVGTAASITGQARRR